MTAIAMTVYGQLPAVQINAADGAQATVTLYGGHLVSWSSADGQERLFCSARSALDGSRAIRGGVPLIFPQFAERGNGMRHGFARVSAWRLAGSGSADGGAFAEFELSQADLDARIAQAWPHAFCLRLRVALRASELRLTLEIRNTGAQAFAFSSALHSYWLTDRLANVRIGGVQDGELAIADKLDKIFFGIDDALTLRSGTGALRLEQDGFRDAVVWNPGAADAAALADMEDDEFERFVCIEAALIEPRRLDPGAVWRGGQRVTATL